MIGTDTQSSPIYWLYSQNTCISWDWAGLELGARDSMGPPTCEWQDPNYWGAASQGVDPPEARIGSRVVLTFRCFGMGHRHPKQRLKCCPECQSLNTHLKRTIPCFLFTYGLYNHHYILTLQNVHAGPAQ